MHLLVTVRRGAISGGPVDLLADKTRRHRTEVTPIDAWRDWGIEDLDELR